MLLLQSARQGLRRRYSQLRGLPRHSKRRTRPRLSAKDIIRKGPKMKSKRKSSKKVSKQSSVSSDLQLYRAYEKFLSNSKKCELQEKLDEAIALLKSSNAAAID